jgi:hypothetical protein
VATPLAVQHSPEFADAIKEKAFQLCYLRGYKQREVAKCLGVSENTICLYLQEAKQEFLSDRIDLSDPVGAIQKQIKQYEDIRAEAWDAWKRSKRDAQSSMAERQLMPIFEKKVDKKTGRETTTLKGREMVTVKEVSRIIGRLPDNAYLQTIKDCLKEEARLRGLVQETVIKLTQINVQAGQAGGVITWDSLAGVDSRPNEVELRIAGAANPPVEDLPTPEEAGWSEAEVAESSDEVEQ